MTVYLIRRLGQAAIVVFAMSLLVFVGVFLIGDPTEILVAQDADQAEFERARRAMGLDRPFYMQYLIFLKNLASGDLGNSFVSGIPAIALILQRMPATMELAFASVMLAITVGISLGMWAGLKPKSIAGRSIMAGSILGFSLPNFWQGLLLIMLFAVFLGWLPAGGRGDTTEFLGLQVSFLTADGLRHMILPSINLALFKMSLIIRLTRAGVREVVHQDYIKFARAKGLGTRRVIGVHVLKNILIPVVTVTGLEFGNVIAFAVVTETVFAWPGMGKLLIDSIALLDRPVIVAYLMIIVFLFIVINLVVDILYSVIDPRVRLQDVQA
ncbi:MAG: ABC transporter permease [Alphaproteobacteria bacterium]